MNRLELLAACFGPDLDYREGDRAIEIKDEETELVVLSHVDLYRRRILIVPEQRPGHVAEAATMIVVAGLGNLCTDPAYRGNGYAAQAVELALAEAAKNQWITFAAVFSTVPELGERFGFRRVDEAAHPSFMVRAIDGVTPWPACRFFDTYGEW